MSDYVVTHSFSVFQWPDGVGVALLRDHAHIPVMAIRKPTFAVSKLNDDLFRGAVLGLLVFLGLIAVLTLVYFGL